MFPLILYLIGGISALVIDRMRLVKNKKIMPWLVAVSIVLALPLRFYGENLLTHINDGNGHLSFCARFC